MKQTIITNSFEETQKLGAEFAKKINSGLVLALYGDLGSGKTTFIQGLAKGLGIQKKIISPTFIIMRSYVIARSETTKQSISTTELPRFARDDIRKITFYHIDLYRIKDEKDVMDLGLIELMQDPQNLFAIEWPEKIKDILSKKTINIFFEYIDENKRKITFNNF